MYRVRLPTYSQPMRFLLCPVVKDQKKKRKKRHASALNHSQILLASINKVSLTSLCNLSGELKQQRLLFTPSSTFKTMEIRISIFSFGCAKWNLLARVGEFMETSWNLSQSRILILNNPKHDLNECYSKMIGKEYLNQNPASKFSGKTKLKCIQTTFL